MQGLEESRDIHYILELIEDHSQQKIKKFILATLSTTVTFIHELVTHLYENK